MKMRVRSAACVLVVVTLAGVVRSACAAADFPPWEREWRKQLADGLAKKFKPEMDKKPLAEALAKLREVSNLSIILDPAAEVKDKPPTITITIKPGEITVADAMKQITTQSGLEMDQLYGVLFVYNKAKVDKDFWKSEDFLIAKMLDGRPERLSYELKDTVTGDAIKELTEGPGIGLAMASDEVKNKKLTFQMTEIGLGNALRWVVRLAGGKIIVDKENMRVVKR